MNEKSNQHADRNMADSQFNSFKPIEGRTEMKSIKSTLDYHLEKAGRNNSDSKFKSFNPIERNKNMKSLMSTLEAHLENASFEYTCMHEKEDSHVFVLYDGFERYHIHFHIRETPEQIIMISEIDARVPEDKRLIAAEFITRINNKSPLGGFEMMFDEGVASYTIKNRFNAETFTFGIFTEMFGDTFFMMDVGIAGFSAICDDGKTALEAFEIAKMIMENKMKAA